MTAELPRRYAIITTTGAATINISDHVKTSYTDIITVWTGDIGSEAIDPISYAITPGSCAFNVQNNVTVGGQSRFSSIPGLNSAIIEIYQEGVEIFSGKIDHLSNIGWADCTINCVGRDSELNRDYVYELIDPATYPDADPKDIGKMLPHVFGTPKRVPFLAAAVGYVSSLTDKIESTDTVLPYLTEASSRLGTLGHISIGGLVSAFTRSGDTITLSDAAGKYIPRGTIVSEVLDEYVYLIGDKVDSIDAVYVDGLLVPAVGYDAYTGDTGDEHATYPGKAVIAFRQNPADITAQVNPGSLLVSDEDAVCDSVDDPNIQEQAATPSSDSEVGSFYVDSGDTEDGSYMGFMEFGNTGEVGDPLKCYPFVKFNNVQIPQGSNVNTASVLFQSDNDSSGYGSVHQKIYGNDVDSPTPPTTYVQFKALVKTSACVEWTSPGWEDGQNYYSGDIAAIIQEIVSRSGWEKGNSLMLMFEDNNTQYPDWNFACGYDPGYCQTVQLIVEWDSGPVSIVPETQNVSVYPIYQSSPAAADNNAFDRNLTTFFDSAVTECDIVAYDSSNHHVCIFKFPALCSAQIQGEIKSITLRIYCDTSFGADPETAVHVLNAGGSTGITVSGNIDPSSGAAWFEIAASAWDEFETTDLYIYFKSNVGSDIRIYEVYFLIEYDGGTQETTASALFSRLSNQSSIGIIGQVTADVTALLTSPEDILEGILAKCGKDDLIDSNSPSSYSTAGTAYSSDSYEISLVVSQPPDVKALMTRVATQLRSIQFWRNNEHFIKLMGISYSVDAVISAGDIWQNQAWVNYTNKNNVGNDLIGKYNHYWWSNDESDNQDIVTAEDSTSQGVYGAQKESFSLAYIPDETQAQAVLDWRLSELENPRLVVEFVGTLTNNINRELGEVITYNTTDSDLNNLLAGLVSSTKKFLITEIAYQGDGCIRIATIELT